MTDAERKSVQGSQREEKRGGVGKLLATAEQKVQDGELEAALDLYRNIIDRFGSLESTRVSVRNTRTLWKATERSVDLLRWRQDYSGALSLLESASKLDPGFGRQHLADKAHLLIESGSETEGLALLQRIVDSDAGSMWAWTLLGAAHVDLGLCQEAEMSLRRALELAVSDSDRASVHWLLFDLGRRQRNAAMVENAWEASCACDAAYLERLPEVCRTLIELRHFDRALDCLRRDSVEARRAFYGGLIEYAGGGSGYYRVAEEIWQHIADRDVAGVDQCPEEYAEACLYIGRPRDSLAALQQLVASRGATVWRLTLLGLTYALLNDVPHAKVHLGAALRLADSLWPRETRPGTGSQRILNQQARIAYGNMIKASDLMAELDSYFIPRKD